MSKVSVLTAVYNDEKHLRKCLDSLCNQTLKDIQIICIDDGSTDSTPEILNEYSSLDSRIVVIRQEENKGQAIARNAGLEVSDGKYITMLDSDDWFCQEAFEIATKAVEAIDGLKGFVGVDLIINADEKDIYSVYLLVRNVVNTEKRINIIKKELICQ